MTTELFIAPGETHSEMPIQVSDKGFADQLQTQTLDTIEIEDHCSKKEIEYIVEVKEKDVRSVVDTETHPAIIFIIPLEDGRLYLGTTKNVKQSLDLIPYKITDGVSPVTIPKKSKLDLAKYWYILSEKYGEENVITNDPGLHKYYKKAFQDCEETRGNLTNPQKSNKKCVFKFHSEVKSGIFTKIKSLASFCKKIAGRWSFFGAIRS